jgi:hypothetical protein
MEPWSAARARKFRQAAWVYLHVAILYEGAAYAMWRHELLPRQFGPPVVWLMAAAVVVGAVFMGLLRWQNVWLARAIWLLHGLRVPALVEGAFFAGGHAVAPAGFYLTGLVVVMANLWMLARAGWDL